MSQPIYLKEFANIMTGNTGLAGVPMGSPEAMANIKPMSGMMPQRIGKGKKNKEPLFRR